ncbi:MAG: DNA translocase FtsK [Spirochaeta sp.]
MSDYRTATDSSRHLPLFLVIGSMFLLFSFVLSMLPYQDFGFGLIVAAQPGRFLFRSFHYAGVTVPLMLYIAALAVRARRFRLDWLVMGVLSALPMGAAAVALRILFAADIHSSPITAAAVRVFGETVAVGVSAFSALVLIVAIYRLGRYLPPRDVAAHAAEEGLDEFEEVDGIDDVDDRYDRFDRPRGARTADTIGSETFNRLVMGGPVSRRSAEAEAETVEPPEAGETETRGAGSEEASEAAGADTAAGGTDEIDEPHSAEFEESPVIHVSFSRPRQMEQEPEAAGEADEETGSDASTEDEVFYESEPEFAPDDELAYEGELAPDDESEDEIEEPDEEQDEEFEALQRDERILADAPPPKRITRGRYSVPVDGLLDQYENNSVGVIGPETKAAGQALKETLKEFNIDAEVTGIRKGPVITMFEILPAPGVKLAKITSLADNIALRLAAQSVRIVAPIPGKHAVGIEIPNQSRSLVSFGELLHEKRFTQRDIGIPLALGKDIPGDAQIIDLTKTPHLLIAGATGSGKSVCVNSIICSILYRHAPEDVRLILIDPKIVELKFYNDIPHLLTPVITDPKRAFQALQYAIYEMERRYSLLDAMGVRDIASYNRRIKERELATASLPYIVIVVDEFADLMATSGKELESTVARLCAMSRAVGIHLVLATQRPSTDVITGLIKANIPSRIAFMVASKVDSRIIIDTGGAEKLLGRGDMLFTSAWDPFPFRMQGAFLSEDEVERVVSHVKTLGEPDYIDDEIFIDDDEEEGYAQPELEDPLMEKAVDIVVSANKASASYLQRRLKIGYNRAARLVEEMERIGIVGPQNGSKARDVIGTPQE